MNDKIKKALGDLAEQVETKLTEAKIELAILNDGSVVPSDKHDSLKKDLTEAQSKLTDANKQVETLTEDLGKLSKSTEDTEALKATIAEANEKAESYKTEADERVLKYKKTAALQTELLGADADAQNIDLLVAQFDLEKIQLTDEGKIIGFEDVLKPIKEKRTALFVKTKVDGVDPKSSSSKAIPTREALITQYEAAEKIGDVGKMRQIDTEIKALKKE